MGIPPKKKKCKGSNAETKGMGCGVETYYRTLGLCKSKCYPEFLLETDPGKIRMAKALLKAKKDVEKIEKKERKERDSMQRIELMSPDKYRVKYVQPLINKIARLIDYGNPCIATGNFEGKMAGGHYTSVGSNRTICLNLHNIFIQSFHSNSWNGGDDKRYRESLINIFGNEYLEFIEGLKKHRPIQLRKPQLIEIKEKAHKICNDLEKNKSLLSSEQRISMRNTINIELGIYDPEFLIFEK